MTAQHPDSSASSTTDTPPSTSIRQKPQAGSSGERPHTRPWRIEGMPKGEPPRNPTPRWLQVAAWIASYLVFFGLLSFQDRMSGPEQVAYTEFKSQVVQKNIAELFSKGDSIQGRLKKPAALPGLKGRTYERFTTERPTFAHDDLLAEVSGQGAVVRATPLVEQRGFLTNLIISVAPFLLFVAFYAWLFKHQKGGVGSLLGGGKQKRVDPESVRTTFADVAGID
jgi:cell division protease FtsH